MPSNIEIKARLANPDCTLQRVETLSPSPAQLLQQEDVFFPCVRGRLKLRIFSSDHGELIHYQRPDIPGAKRSDYEIIPTSAPLKLRDAMASALGVLAVVKKRRFLYLVGQTRIHLDNVEGLGRFLELEVVMKPDQTVEEGIQIARELMRALDIKETDLIDCAYVDLLLRKMSAGRDVAPWPHP